MINPRAVTILSGMKRLIIPHYPVQSISPNFHRGPIPHSQSNPPAVYSKPYAQNFEQRLDFWCKRGLEYKNTIWNNEKKFVSPKIVTHPILEDSDEAKIKLMKPSSKEMVLEVNEIIQTLQDSSNTEIKLTKSLREAMALKDSKIKQIPQDSYEAKISEAMALKESKIKQIPEDSSKAEINLTKSLNEAMALKESKIEPKSEIEELLRESEKISMSVRESLSKSPINSPVSEETGASQSSINSTLSEANGVAIKLIPPLDISSEKPFRIFMPSSEIKPNSSSYARRHNDIFNDWQGIKIQRLGDAGRI